MTDPAVEGLSSKVFAAARNLIVDRTTAEVVTEFAAAGIPTILLKGPSIARWLYPDDPRMYVDTDLLVSPQDAQTAETILRNLKFEPPMPEGPAERPWQVHDWRRNRDGAFIDLHRTVPAAEASPTVVWSALTRETEEIEVGGVRIEILSLPARALHVALHAAQPGADMTKPLEDLQRALDQTPLEVWRVASEIATEIEAKRAMGAGLALLPSGHKILDQLGVEGGPRVETILAHADISRSAAGYALAIKELGDVRGVRAKLLWLWAKAVPPPVFMRYWSPLARRGWPGLLAAYPWRWFWLAKTAVPGVRAWIWARRQARGAPPRHP